MRSTREREGRPRTAPLRRFPAAVPCGGSPARGGKSLDSFAKRATLAPRTKRRHGKNLLERSRFYARSQYHVGAHVAHLQNGHGGQPRHPFVVTELRVAGAMLLFRAASFFTKSEHVSARDLLSLFAAFLIAIAPPSCGTRLVPRPTFRAQGSLLSKAPRPRGAPQAWSCSFFSSFLL